MKLLKLGKKKERYKCVQYGMFNNIEFNPESFIDIFEKIGE